jgi:hypothetical protein
MPEKIICDCGHPLEVHNLYGCMYAFERQNECHCPLGKETIIARYWARKMKRDVDVANQKALEATNKLNYFMAWRNANDPYA